MPGKFRPLKRPNDPVRLRRHARDRHQTPVPAAWVGIDLRPHTLDACLLLAPDGKPRTPTFANDTTGHTALVAGADEHAGGATLGFCRESTGPQGDARATTRSPPRLSAPSCPSRAASPPPPTYQR